MGASGMAGTGGPESVNSEKSNDISRVAGSREGATVDMTAQELREIGQHLAGTMSRTDTRGAPAGSALL
jgi:hypothetical protein